MVVRPRMTDFPAALLGTFHSLRSHAPARCRRERIAVSARGRDFLAMATRALGKIGDRCAGDPLLPLVDGEHGWVHS